MDWNEEDWLNDDGIINPEYTKWFNEYMRQMSSGRNPTNTHEMPDEWIKEPTKKKGYEKAKADFKKKKAKEEKEADEEYRKEHNLGDDGMKKKKKKLRVKKFNPAKNKHEWFVESKLPKHTK